MRQAHEPRGVNEEPGYDEDGLVVRGGWVAEHSQIPGFVDKAKLQLRGSRQSYGHPSVAIGSAAHMGSAIHAEAWLLPAT